MSKTMRVLQIVHRDEAGGVKTLSEALADGLAAREISVETATLFPGSGAGLAARLGGAWQAARRILSGRYDAVIAYQASASILVGMVGWIARCPLRIVHQTALPSEVGAPLRLFDRGAGALGLYTTNVVNSRATAAAFARYPARYRRAMTMIEHGVAPPRAAHSRALTLARFAVPDDRRILLNVGRLTEQKNQETLIDALARVPSARLLIAGDGPRRAEHAARAVRNGVADRVHLLGDVTRDDVADLLAACDLFVFPSVWETFGLAAVEAAMAGVPIVAADLPVLREVLSSEAGDAARFVAPADAAGWAAAMTAALEAKRAEPGAIADAVARRYGVVRMVEAYAALLGAGRAPATAPHGTPVAKPDRDSDQTPCPVPLRDRATALPRHQPRFD
jgi:L-malate glycosyltransferase